jgi:hypothetical protein
MDAKNDGTGQRANAEPAPDDDRLRGAIKSRDNPQTNPAQVALYYGTARAPLARIVSDDTYPTMWRIVWPDGRVSDMANLARAKDAAAAICERGPPARYRRLFHWKRDASNSPPEARTSRQSDEWADWPASDAGAG